MAIIAIQYCFQLSDERQEIFNLELDEESLELVGNVQDSLPDWTRLDFHQCANCPLGVDTHPYCPVALHLADIVRRFEEILSYDEVHVDVFTEERRISQDTTAQLGLASLMGLMMAASGCPHMAFFKPMVRFHLPMSTDEETIYRAVSMYLLAQYFVRQKDRQTDFHLEGLKDIYKNVQLTNSYVADRLRAATKSDSSLNGLITLDMFAKTMLFAIKESLEDIRYLFRPYLDDLHLETRK
jgi:hypothetical protein